MTTSRSRFTLAVMVLALAHAFLACSGDGAGNGGETGAISGTVSGAVSQGVTVTLGGASSATTTTDAAGHYGFADLADGSYTVTPSLAGFGFDPASRSVSLSGADVGGQDFVASALAHAISGTVSGMVRVGVTVALAGESSATTDADGWGRYSFAGLVDGSYTVTPSFTGYTFDPPSRAILLSGADVGGQDFVSRPYTGVSGPHHIGHLAYLVVDATRAGRPVAINVWYPADGASISAASPPAVYPLDPIIPGGGSSSSAQWEALGYDRAYEQPATSLDGPFPLVVLSPGSTCPGWYHVGLAARLASHGYVTAVLDHYGDGWGHAPVTLTLQEKMFHRPRDVSFAITHLLAMNDEPGGLLHGAIDASAIAAGGHSAGGYTAFALTVGDDLVCDAAWAVAVDGSVVESTCVPTPADARVKALVSLDGAAQLLKHAELARMPVPSLILGETVAALTSVYGAPLETWNARPHAAIQRPDSYRVDVERSVHMSYANACDGLAIAATNGFLTEAYVNTLRNQFGCVTALSQAEMQQVMTRYVVAFLNVHLRGIAADAVTLTPADAATRTPRVEFIDSETCSAALPDETYFSYRTLQAGGVCAVARKDPVEFFAPP